MKKFLAGVGVLLAIAVVIYLADAVCGVRVSSKLGAAGRLAHFMAIWMGGACWMRLVMANLNK